MSGRSPIAYYVTGHGYGHGSRSCDILSALHDLAPDRERIVVTDLSRRFLDSRLDPGTFRHRSKALDVGLVQLDSVRSDVDATLGLLKALYARRERLVEEEVSFLQDEAVGLVVSDIPAVPLAAGQRAGVPTVAVGNFGWDWIYSAYRDRDPAWGPIIDSISEAYAGTDLLLRLPFSEPMAAFPRQVDLPVVARPGRERRTELAAMTGADPAKRWVLLSFTTLEWGREALERVARLMQYEFFTVLPLAWQGGNTHAVDQSVMSFADALASCDAVISKPGFGIVSECVVNRKPLLYVDRTDFLEYPILVDAIGRYIQNCHLPAADLYAGQVERGLGELWVAPPPPEELAADGARFAAQQLLAFAGC
jgi:L-arabinokinase